MGGPTWNQAAQAGLSLSALDLCPLCPSCGSRPATGSSGEAGVGGGQRFRVRDPAVQAGGKEADDPCTPSLLPCPSTPALSCSSMTSELDRDTLQLCWPFPPPPSWHRSPPRVRVTPGCSPGFNSKGSGGTLHPPLPVTPLPTHAASSDPPLLCAPSIPRVCPEFSSSRRREEGLATPLCLWGPLTVLRDDPGHLLGCWGVALDLTAYHQPVHL